MAAETLAHEGFSVTVYERKASLGRKFLMAGRGGLNLTHSEDLVRFKERYNEAKEFLSPIIDNFTPIRLREWSADLGEPTFIGSSGRIFPQSFKASPLLRAWIRKLDHLGVQFKMQRDWLGWGLNKELIFSSPEQNNEIDDPDFTVLALGGASWPSLGSDGSWVKILADQNIPITPLAPANCGFQLNWSDIFKEKFSGAPLKTITLTFENYTVPGEVMISQSGIEGGAIYALSSRLRKSLHLGKDTIFYIDLRPSMNLDDVIKKTSRPRKSQSLSTYLQKTLNLSPVEINLLREVDLKVSDYPPHELASLIKSVPVRVRKTYPIEKAISSAGGIQLDAIDQNLMLKIMPGTFVAGEMLDWEAPTGGYLLQASFATGYAAAMGIINYAKRL